MFYAQDILRRRGGKFGVIWLAATDPNLLTRRDFSVVDINRTCSEILDHILHRISQRTGRKASRFSLYLSSKLMFGVTYVFRKQFMYLLDDIKTLQESIYTIRFDIKEEEIQLPVRLPLVTLDDPIKKIQNPEFGRLIEESLLFPEVQYEYFPVLSPRSPELPEGLSPVDFKTRAERKSEEEEKGVLPYTVPPAEITMPEEAMIPSIREEEISLPIAHDLLPFGLDEFESPVIPPAVPEISEQPIMPEYTFLSPGRLLEASPLIKEVTPVLPPAQIEPKRPEKHVPPQEIIEKTPVSEIITERPGKRVKRKTEELSDFELLPPIKPHKRARKHILFFDEQTLISAEEFKSGITAANKRLTQPLMIPSLSKPPNILFQQPGSRIGSSVLQKFWKRLKTSSEPNDPAKPGSYTIVKETISEAEELSPPVLLPELPVKERQEEIERLREKSLQEESVLLITPAASFQEISGISVHPEISARPSLVKSPPTEIIPTMMPIMEEEPLLEIEPEEMILRPEKPICERIISPVHTPPPPSPEELTSPSHRKVFSMFSQHLTEISPSEIVKFHSLVPAATNSRKKAAVIFSRLLDLHKMQVVELKQQTSYGDIAILKGKKH